jgi:prevent-host-death family protein
MRVERNVSVREARDQLGRLIDAAHYAGEITIITRHGEPWAAIVPLEMAAQTATEDHVPHAS